MILIYFLALNDLADEMSAEIIREIRSNILEFEFIGIGGPKMLKQLNTRDKILDFRTLSKKDSKNFISKFYYQNILVNKVANELLISQPDIFISIGSENITCKIAKIISQYSLPTKLFHLALTNIKANKIFEDNYSLVFLANTVDLITFENKNINNNFLGHPILRNKLNFDPSYFIDKKQCDDTDIILTLDLLHDTNFRSFKKFVEIAIHLKQRLQKLKIAILLPHQSFEESKEKILKKEIITKFSEEDIFFEQRENRINVYAASKVVITTINDYNLEIAASDTPFISIYEENVLMKFLRKIFSYTKYKSILNKTISQEVVLEFDQNEDNTAIIVNNLYNIITEQQIAKYYVCVMHKILNLFKPEQNIKIIHEISQILYSSLSK